MDLTDAIRAIVRAEVDARFAAMMTPHQLRGALAVVAPSLSVAEIAAECGQPLATVRGWVRSGALRGQRVNGRGDWRVERGTWEAFRKGGLFNKLARRRSAARLLSVEVQ